MNQDWIDVKKRKPKSGRTVLIKSTKKFITTDSYVGLGQWWNAKDSGSETGSWSERLLHDDDPNTDTITHWQPLPR